MTSREYPQSVPAGSTDAARTDEELMRDLARGQQEALGPLYSRYAALVFHIGVQSLDRTAAEELVQEVFLNIWRGSTSFDPSQGAFRPWLLRLTHWKILNELRRQRRRPPGDDAEDSISELPDDEPGPDERAWQKEHDRIVLSALETLPPKQRQAIALAFLEGMTHEQVASTLQVPLGTAKTRIRSGLQSLRVYLAPVAASLLGLGLAIVGFRYVQNQVALERDERALTLVTTSELVPLRLIPASASVPAGAHANYRGRPDNSLAVLTTELLPSPPAGSAYQAWVRHAGQWTSLGTLVPNADGTARLIAENPELATTPDVVEITLESSAGSALPSGQVVLAWPAP